LFVLCFLVHNLLSTNPRKRITGSKDADCRLVVFLKKQKGPSCGCGSGPDEVDHNIWTTLLRRNPQKGSQNI